MKKLKHKKSIVIWLTGIPCSGKTTISKKLEKYFKDKNIPVQRLDGDIMRKTISSDLGFSKKDRDENIKRVAYLAKILAEKNINVIVAFVSPYRKMRSFARKICPNFIEVYVKCGIETCIKRDRKGMYEKAMKGKIKNFTGINDIYEYPKNPGITIETDKLDIGESVSKIINYINKNYR
jgi:adenylyl-sulfate kinase